MPVSTHVTIMSLLSRIVIYICSDSRSLSLKRLSSQYHARVRVIELSFGFIKLFKFSHMHVNKIENTKAVITGTISVALREFKPAAGQSLMDGTLFTSASGASSSWNGVWGSWGWRGNRNEARCPRLRRLGGIMLSHNILAVYII